MGSQESSPFAEEMKTYVQTSNDELNKITYYYSAEKDQYILVRKMIYNDRNSYEVSKKKHEERLKRPSNTNLQRLLSNLPDYPRVLRSDQGRSLFHCPRNLRDVGTFPLHSLRRSAREICLE